MRLGVWDVWLVGWTGSRRIPADDVDFVLSFATYVSVVNVQISGVGLTQHVGTFLSAMWML